jgi:hypothetical protein
MLAASPCWPALSMAECGAFGWSNRYGSSVPCVARPRLAPAMVTGALSSLNWSAYVRTRAAVQRSTCRAGHAKLASETSRLKAAPGDG